MRLSDCNGCGKSVKYHDIDHALYWDIGSKLGNEMLNEFYISDVLTERCKNEVLQMNENSSYLILMDELHGRNI
jgi:hypothetical protein